MRTCMWTYGYSYAMKEEKNIISFLKCHDKTKMEKNPSFNKVQLRACCLLICLLHLFTSSKISFPLVQVYLCTHWLFFSIFERSAVYYIELNWLINQNQRKINPHGRSLMFSQHIYITINFIPIWHNRCGSQT